MNDTATETGSGASTSAEFNTIEEAIAAIAAGEMVVVVDDDDRENEGDLIMAASKATPESVAFMIRHTSGILCTPILEDQANSLHLDPMVARNDAPMSTAFTVSIDYKHGLTTGISAEERAATVQALTTSNVRSEISCGPDTYFRWSARQGGVLVRSGHTEAGIDLQRWPVCRRWPAGGARQRRRHRATACRSCIEFAAEHKLKTHHDRRPDRVPADARAAVERTMRVRSQHAHRRAPAPSLTEPVRGGEHLALVFGERQLDSVPVRIHREKLVADVFGPQTQHEQNLVGAALTRIETLGGGVLIYLRTGHVGVPHEDLREQSKEDERRSQWLEVGVGAQILKDLGVSKIRLIAGREVAYKGVSGFGLTLESTEIL